MEIIRRSADSEAMACWPPRTDTKSNGNKRPGDIEEGELLQAENSSDVPKREGAVAAIPMTKSRDVDTLTKPG
jgi:hypothetical protein